MSKKVFLPTPSLIFLHNFLLEAQNHKRIFGGVDFKTFLSIKSFEKSCSTMPKWPLKSVGFTKQMKND